MFTVKRPGETFKTAIYAEAWAKCKEWKARGWTVTVTEKVKGREVERFW